MDEASGYLPEVPETAEHHGTSLTLKALYGTKLAWQEPIAVQGKVPFCCVLAGGIKRPPALLQDASFRPESVPRHIRCSPEGSHPVPTALC